MTSSGKRFATRDGRFGLSVEGATVRRLLRLCRSARDVETGGILAGYYSDRMDCAVVTYVSGPPKDSKATPTSFYRGVKGLQRRLNTAWANRREFYLGDWHYHPYATAEASGVDARQLKVFSEDTMLACPEPILLIVGGDPDGEWEAKAYVHPRDGHLRMMLEQSGSAVVNAEGRLSRNGKEYRGVV